MKGGLQRVCPRTVLSYYYIGVNGIWQTDGYHGIIERCRNSYHNEVQVGEDEEEEEETGGNDKLATVDITRSDKRVRGSVCSEYNNCNIIPTYDDQYYSIRTRSLTCRVALINDFTYCMDIMYKYDCQKRNGTDCTIRPMSVSFSIGRRSGRHKICLPNDRGSYQTRPSLGGSDGRLDSKAFIAAVVAAVVSSTYAVLLTLQIQVI